MTARPLFEILDGIETPIGAICLRRRELPGRPGTIVTEVTIDGEMLMSSYQTESERALATHAFALAEGDGLRVLVGGLGLGYTARAALADPRVARVRVVEKMPIVIGWLREGLLPLAEELQADPRFEVVEGDVYADLLGPPGDAFDVLLIDVDHTPTERLDAASTPFYTVEGQRRVAAHLAPGAVLAVWSARDDDAFADVLAAAYPVARREPVHWTDDTLEAGEEIENMIFLARR